MIQICFIDININNNINWLIARKINDYLKTFLARNIAHCTDKKFEYLTCGWVARTPESNSLLSRSCRTYLEKWRKGIVLIWLVVNFVSITIIVVVTIIILKCEDLTTAALAFSPSASGSTRSGRSDTWGPTLWGWHDGGNDDDDECDEQDNSGDYY